MVESIQKFFAEFFTNPYIAVFLISMIPIIELRGAIPFGKLYYDLGLFPSIGLSVLGGAVVSILLLLFLIPIFRLLKKTKLFKRIIEFFERKFKKQSDKIEKKVSDNELLVKKKNAEWIKFWSILFFVAIPLPGTGVWTGSAIAVFCNMKFKHALLAVTLGNMVAGGIVSLITLLF